MWHSYQLQAKNKNYREPRLSLCVNLFWNIGTTLTTRLMKCTHLIWTLTRLINKADCDIYQIFSYTFWKVARCGNVGGKSTAHWGIHWAENRKNANIGLLLHSANCHLNQPDLHHLGLWLPLTTVASPAPVLSIFAPTRFTIHKPYHKPKITSPVGVSLVLHFDFASLS